MASTLVGADMSHVICEKYAGDVIKSYSPNLIVHPYLFETEHLPSGHSIQNVVEKVCSVLDRIHVVVIGPGLGRDKTMLETTAAIIQEAKKRKLPIVIDADGLYLIQNQPDLIKGYEKAILTPNVVEFQRLCKALEIDDAGGDDPASAPKVSKLATTFGGLTILEKGKLDNISNGHTTISNDISGGPKRVSGQGDTLSGSIAAFLAWQLAYEQKLWDTEPIKEAQDSRDLTLLAVFAASSITRTASALAYKNHGRALLTSDISDSVGAAFKQLFE
ncbi:NADHX dehydratase [Sugiyamaella lignohabitans]|uniref:ATP-dependent (S)-NAD(P)H-hydrate dehydratase n=1 Tax=Sugiyamaella lignohabitans TaxID=796027 RepID=A0A167E876_9ASCO|nr:NADHX dehydratase [Sugiyamaella lignohabitans]ANB13761.1 NADHX dehydratase [Sugiyamaella lignohabitans]